MRNEKFSYLIRIVAGIYLIRLAVKMVQEGILGTEIEGGNVVMGTIACVLFVGAAVFFIVSSIVGMTKMVKEQIADAKNQEAKSDEAIETTESAEQTAEEADEPDEAIEEAEKVTDPTEETEQEKS